MKTTEPHDPMCHPHARHRRSLSDRQTQKQSQQTRPVPRGSTIGGALSGSTALCPPFSSSPRSRDGPDTHTVGTSTPGAVASQHQPYPVLGASPSGQAWRRQRQPHSFLPDAIPGTGVTCEPASELCALVALGPLKGRARGDRMGRSVSQFCGLTRRTPPRGPRPPSLCRSVVGSWDTARGSGTQPL